MESTQRWRRVLAYLTEALPSGTVTVDGHQHVDEFATRLADALAEAGRADVTVRADSPVRVWLRTPLEPGRESHEPGAQIVVDLHRPSWPVLRRIDESMMDRSRWYLAETQAFFAIRAKTWETKYGDDGPAYAAAIAESGIAPDSVAVDVGCGTGRAMPALREAVGPGGRVIGFDLTREMLATARELGRERFGGLVLADARRLPLGEATVDAVFAAGLIGHVPEVDPVLTELARVTRSGGRLVLFHPTARATLAARRGRVLRDGEPLDEAPLRAALARTGWSLHRYDDTDHRFYAQGVRTG